MRYDTDYSCLKALGDHLVARFKASFDAVTTADTLKGIYNIKCIYSICFIPFPFFRRNQHRNVRN